MSTSCRKAPVLVWRLILKAEVAELADARGSGPRTRKGVGVRVPSSAPEFFFSNHLTAWYPRNAGLVWNLREDQALSLPQLPLD
jgi:hypothetical protein